MLQYFTRVMPLILGLSMYALSMRFNIAQIYNIRKNALIIIGTKPPHINTLTYLAHIQEIMIHTSVRI